MFDMLMPASISSVHEYSSKLSADKYISISDVRAVSSVTMYIPSGLKYMFTSLSISLRTSNVDLNALAWIVNSFSISR